MRRSTAAVLLIWRLVKLTALTLVLVPGLMINGPIGLVARTISHRKAVEAKLASSVKIAGRDVLATWKLMVAVVLVPLVHMLGAAWVTIMVGDALSPRWSTLSVFFIALAGLIMVSTGSIQFLESASDTYKLLPPLWLCVRGMT